MKITIEVEMDDSLSQTAFDNRLQHATAFAKGFVESCRTKPGGYDEYKADRHLCGLMCVESLTVTIDRTDIEKRPPLKAYASHSFVGRNYSLNCYGVVVAPNEAEAARLLDAQLLADDIPQPRDTEPSDMIEVDLSVPKAYIVKDE